MTEVLDYYNFAGLPRTSAWEEVRKKIKQQYLEFQKKANVKGPGSKEAERRDFWGKALEYFKDEASKKDYDAKLDAWLKSVESQAAQAQAKSAAEDFVQRSTGALELLQQAWRELERGNVAEAMLLAGKAVALDPGSWEAFFALGIANFRGDDLDEAMSCLRTASRLNPKSADVLAGIGEIYERRERWKDAYEQYRLASLIDPDESSYLVSMGLACVKAGVPDEGIEILRACQMKDPSDPGLNWVLGVALAESARLGWSYVEQGHPRVSEGWYAMSRDQALQAVAKLHEATTLRIEDPDLSKHLAEVQTDVNSNVKRRFTGNWILLGLIGVLALAGSGAMAKIVLGLFAASYYIVNLVPQYAINARVLAGESAVKRGFFDWLDNLTNPWVKLGVLGGLFVLLPVFIVYWGIRNWTGSNAPIGKIVDDLRSKHAPGAEPSANGAPDIEGSNNQSITSSETDVKAIAVPATSGLGERIANGFGDRITSAAQTAAKAQTSAKVHVTRLGGGANNVGEVLVRTASLYAKANKLFIAMGALIIVLVSAFGSFYFNKSKSDDQPKVGEGGALTQTGLDLKWRGTWVSADGRRVLSIGEQRIDAIDRIYTDGRGEDERRYTLKFVASQAGAQEERVSFSGRVASLVQLSKEYEESVQRFKAGEPDFKVNLRKLEQTRSDLNSFKPGSYQELEGYLGGDCSWWKWYNDGDHILEVMHCKYAHEVTLLTRGTEANAQQAYLLSKRTEQERERVERAALEQKAAQTREDALRANAASDATRAQESAKPPQIERAASAASPARQNQVQGAQVSRQPTVKSNNALSSPAPVKATTLPQTQTATPAQAATPAPTPVVTSVPSPAPAPAQEVQVQFSCSSLPFTLRLACSIEGKEIIRKCAPDLKSWNNSLPGCARQSSSDNSRN